jgi:hypothetical protein
MKDGELKYSVSGWFEFVAAWEAAAWFALSNATAKAKEEMQRR